MCFSYIPTSISLLSSPCYFFLPWARPSNLELNYFIYRPAPRDRECSNIWLAYAHFALFIQKIIGIDWFEHKVPIIVNRLIINNQYLSVICLLAWVTVDHRWPEHTVSCISSYNGQIVTGSRLTFDLGRHVNIVMFTFKSPDHPNFSKMPGVWDCKMFPPYLIFKWWFHPLFIPFCLVLSVFWIWFDWIVDIFLFSF